MIKNVRLVSFYRHIILMFVPHEILPVCIWGEYEYVCGGSYDISADTLRYTVLQSGRLFWTLKLCLHLPHLLDLLGVLMTFPAPN